MNYAAVWKDLKRRRIAYEIARFFPIAFFFAYSQLHNSPTPWIAKALALLSPWSWFGVSVVVVLGFLGWMLAFRCPRCRKRFMEISGINKNCAHCGLPINTEA